MNKKDNAPKRKLFGRNLFTLLVVCGGFILIMLIAFSTVSYVTTYNKSKITPFIDKDFDEQFTVEDYNIDNITRVHHSEFEDFGVIFKCTEYSEDSNTAKFRLKTYKKEGTKNITGNITANVMMTAEWINFVSYASKTTTLKMYESEEKALESNKSSYYKDFTVKNLADFPAKADTFPVKVSVDEPSIYSYISYKYIQSGETKTLSYVLEYSYLDLKPETGGIRK